MSKPLNPGKSELLAPAQTKTEIAGPTSPAPNPHPVTPDGRYFVVRGRLWRTADPSLSVDQRQGFVDELMSARRAVRTAKLAGDASALAVARGAVDGAKRALGERGPVWWADGAPDLNRHMASNTPYAQWFSEIYMSDNPGEHRADKSSDKAA